MTRMSLLEDPFGPGLDPASCAHAWEMHFWEVGTMYCPHCGAGQKVDPDRLRELGVTE